MHNSALSHSQGAQHAVNSQRNGSKWRSARCIMMCGFIGQSMPLCPISVFARRASRSMMRCVHAARCWHSSDAAEPDLELHGSSLALSGTYVPSCMTGDAPCSDAPALLCELPVRSTVGLPHPFIATALAQLRKHNSCKVGIYVLCCDTQGRYVLRADVWVPKELLQNLIPWKASRLVGEALARLLPGSTAALQHVDACPLCTRTGSTQTPAGGSEQQAGACIACGAAAPPAGSAAQAHAGPCGPCAPWFQAQHIAEGMLTPRGAGDGGAAAPGLFKDCVMQLPNWLLEAPQLPPAPPVHAGAALPLAELPREVLGVILRQLGDVTAVACTCRCGVLSVRPRQSMPELHSGEWRTLCLGLQFHRLRSYPALPVHVVNASCWQKDRQWRLSSGMLPSSFAILRRGSLAAACRRLRAVCDEAIPDLKLRLHPHQNAGLHQMLARERHAAAPRPHPTLRALPTLPSEGLLLCDTASGAVSTAEAPEVHDFQGGFCCDEPGLGKTVTALALVLKTHGALPAVPRGCALSQRSMAFKHLGIEREISGYVCATPAPEDGVACADADASAAAASEPQLAGAAGAFQHGQHATRNGLYGLGSPSRVSTRSKRSRSALELLADTSRPPARKLRRRSGTAETPVSAATVIVCPPTLVPHWQEQIAMHVAAGTLRVYTMQNAQDADVDPRQLAWDYDVVLTTFSHLSAQAAASMTGAKSVGAGAGNVHVLMRVHWLRVMLDEGHMLGSAAVTARLQVRSGLTLPEVRMACGRVLDCPDRH